jgi:hypothetical protein
MSTTDTPPGTAPAPGPEGAPPPQPDPNDVIKSLQRQNEDLAAALRNATQSRGLETAPAPQPAAPGMTLEQQLHALDNDERYMNLGASQKAALAAQLLYNAQIKPEADRLQRSTAQNTVAMFRNMRSGEKDALKIMEIFNGGLAPIHELAKLEADDLNKYLDGVWMAAVGTFYRQAQAAAPAPREEPINLGGGAGRSASLPAGGATTLTIDQLDEKTIRLGRQLGWDDEKILKTAQRALDNPED